MEGKVKIYIDEKYIGLGFIDCSLLSFEDNLKEKSFKFEIRACLKKDESNNLFKKFKQILPFDVVFEDYDIVYNFKNCWVGNESYTFFAEDYIIIDSNLECEKLITYTKERYKAMVCDNGKCNPDKLDLKDKAIKMLRDSFEKQLKSVEKIACRKNSPDTERARKELLDKFESYLKELLVC